MILVILVILMNLVYPTILVILMKYITVMVSWFMEEEPGILGGQVIDLDREDVIFPTPGVGMRCPSYDAVSSLVSHMLGFRVCLERCCLSPAISVTHSRL